MFEEVVSPAINCVINKNEALPLVAYFGSKVDCITMHYHYIYLIDAFYNIPLLLNGHLLLSSYNRIHTGALLELKA
jgi:hypothetical protein